MPGLTGERFRLARELLGWSRPRLAIEARVPHTAVAAVEGGDRVEAEMVIRLQRRLEAAGIDFDEGSDELGVRLRKVAT